MSEPAARRRGPGRPWKKGQSGNPGGRPKALQELIILAREHTVEAINTLAMIMRDTTAPYAARNAAATALLDRGWGKPTQPLSGDADRTPIAMFVIEGLQDDASGHTDD